MQYYYTGSSLVATQVRSLIRWYLVSIENYCQYVRERIPFEKLRRTRRMVQKETKFNLWFWLLTEPQTLTQTQSKQPIVAVRVKMILVYWTFFGCVVIFWRIFHLCCRRSFITQLYYDQCAPESLIDSKENPVCLYSAAQTKRSWSRTKCVVFHMDIYQTRNTAKD